MASLMPLVHESNYEKQKSALVLDFEKFLASNVGSGFRVTSTDPSMCVPDDIVKFLADRDMKGRTQSHAIGCSHLGKKGVFDCKCIVTLSAGTIDSYIGKLRAYFNSIGRNDAWRPNYKWGNPCDSLNVKQYLKAMGLEQRAAHVSPSQAPPLFSDKLRLLVTEIKRQIRKTDDQTHYANIYVLKRDLAFFLVSWWAADRAGDLGKIMGVEMTKLPNGFLMMNHTLGKTIRESRGELVIIPSTPEDPVMDPILALTNLVGFMKSHNLDPISNYVFRPTQRPRHTTLSNKPFTSSDATSRMQVYFSKLGLQDLKLTAHSARAGCATTLLLLGVSKDKVKAHARWATDQMIKHYTRVDEVFSQKETVAVLKNAVETYENGVCISDSVSALYDILNQGVGQSPAFTF